MTLRKLPRISFTYYDIALIILLPLVLLYIIELMHRGSNIDVFEWMITYTNEFIVNYLLYFSVINIFFIYYRRIYTIAFSIICSVLVITAFISQVKEKFRGEPLIPWDLKLGKEAANVSSYLEQMITTKTVGLAILLLVSIFIFIYFSTNKKYGHQSLLLFLISVTLLVTITTDKPIALKNKLKIEYVGWDQGFHYARNGFLFGFLQSAEKMIVKPPKGYSKQNIESVVNEIEKSKESDDSIQPNIIYIMSEAFWDPTVLPVTFSEDPIPFFHRLQKEQTNGTMLAHVFGGGTVNTEFEALTAFSIQFLPQGTSSYVHYIHEPTASIAWLLKEQGYFTSAIHSYSSWFYRRDAVYKLLGFDEFMPFEFFVEPTVNGAYIEDVHITKNIIDTIKKTDGPNFIHAVTMEGHGPYPSGEPEENTIKVSGDISAESVQILESYSEKIRGADRALEQLITELEKIDEPTIVLFFGDHLPALGPEYKVYHETNFFEDGHTYEDYLNMYSLPFIVWDNFTNTKETIRMTPNFFTPYILQRMNHPMTSFYSYVHDLYNEGIEVIPRHTFYEEENVDPSLLQTYELLQYDMLIGEKYYNDDLITLHNNDEYKMKGVHDAQIYGAYPEELRKNMLFNPGDGKHRIQIKGNHFPERLFAYVNGEQQSTYVENKRTVTISLEDELFEDGKVDIYLKVLDVQGRPLAMYDPVTITKVDEQTYVQDRLKSFQEKILDGGQEWEHFAEGDGYDIVRVDLGITEVKEYLLFKGEAEFEQGNANEFHKANLADIYENGYLYVSLSKSETGWKVPPTDKEIKTFFTKQPLRFYIDS